MFFDLSGNIALNRPATQVNDYTFNTYAGAAVDGNLNPVFSGHSCACTKNSSPAPWLKIYLGEKAALIYSIALVNRKAARE